MITCPNCGELTEEEIWIYSERLRKQIFSMTPILPICKRCGAEADVKHTCKGGYIIIINGTCGSGKSTIAEILVKKGFLAIDGDCVIQVAKYKKGTKNVDFREITSEIASEIDILSLYGDNFVLSSVILPEDMDNYIKMFESRNLKYNMFLLRPEYQTAVYRCQSRTCHTSITPEYWIKYFYDILEFDGRVMVIDNTNITAEETAEQILVKSLTHEKINQGVKNDNI